MSLRSLRRKQRMEQQNLNLSYLDSELRALSSDTEEIVFDICQRKMSTSKTMEMESKIIDHLINSWGFRPSEFYVRVESTMKQNLEAGQDHNPFFDGRTYCKIELLA